MKIKQWLSSLFSSYKFEQVQVEEEVLDEIVRLALGAHPREFIAFLEGRVKNKVLKITGLFYQEYFADENSAFARINFPMGLNVVGTVHSHPVPSTRPSDADLFLFSKQGMVHMIIKTPYRKSDIAIFDSAGKRISVAVA